ncbi:hypothetical protein Cabys_2818 [Caldithrix abyssi DSM 13497]|uniref:Uncharacterized protein n=1 Tax=Caldithrix abyssi DSM 13497 TaxID=880073 RepID=A0A1J1CAK8_CALAY|nr:hypothetical protein Cabys_2818 [Caldithrix abyssi DSM 13497]
MLNHFLSFKIIQILMITYCAYVPKTDATVKGKTWFSLIGVKLGECAM